MKRRTWRKGTDKYRGGQRKYSAQDAAQMVAVLLALEAGEISEGIAARALQTDRVSLRDAKIKITEIGVDLACEWRSKNASNTEVAGTDPAQ